jgi:hypothetical protein
MILKDTRKRQRQTIEVFSPVREDYLPKNAEDQAA